MFNFPYVHKNKTEKNQNTQVIIYIAEYLLADIFFRIL